MQDKQIYTTARSEEIKRQLSKISQQIKERFISSKKNQNKPETSDTKVDGKEEKLTNPRVKKQNVQIFYEESQKPTSKSDNDKKNTTEGISEQTLYAIFIYTLFAIILLIIVVATYLSYFTQR